MRFSVVIYLLVISSLLFSGSFHKEFPLQTWNSQYPESAWGAVYSKNIVTKLVSDKVVAVNVYKTKEISADPGAGSFGDIAHTYVYGTGFQDIVGITYDTRLVLLENKLKNTPESAGSTTPEFENKGEKNLESYTDGNGEGTMVVDDFNNDGKYDLFFYNSSKKAVFISDFVSFVKRDGGNLKYYDVQNQDEDFITDWTVSAMVSFDYNGDGYKDVIYADRAGRFWVWYYDPEEESIGKDDIEPLFEDEDLLSGSGKENNATVFDMGDVNNDSIPDIVAGYTSKKHIFIYLGKIENNKLTFDPDEKIFLTRDDGSLEAAEIDKSNTQSKSPKDLPSFAPVIIKITDVDLDGNKDIFVATDAWRQVATDAQGQDENFGGSVYLFKGKEPEANRPKFVSLELVKGEYSKNGTMYDFDAGTIGDLNNDGIPDLVIADGNHTGNYYTIITKIENKYNTEPGFMISDYMYRVVGIPPSDLSNNFIKKIKVTVQFDKSLGDGYFEIRYIKNGIKDSRFIDYNNYPLMPGIPGNGKKVSELPDDGSDVGSFQTEIEFEHPVPKPQVIIVLKPLNEDSAPHLVKLIYEVETEPARAVIKEFNWSKGAEGIR